MIRRLLVLLLAALLAAGCGTVPTSGPIRSSNQAGAPNEQPVEVLAPPPAQGAKPAQIVSGFLEAMGHPRNFDVARQYLTEEAAGRWRPERGAVVYDDSPQETVLSPDAQGNYVLNAPRIATLDSRGSWRSAAPGNKLTFKFVLAAAQGEWRIAEPPPEGVYINKFQMENNFQLVNLYFFTPALDRLVPEPVYLPRQATVSQSASQRTKALLDGPTSRLGSSVATLVPDDTQINVSVPVDPSSVATVSLNEAPTRLGPDERRKLAAQIVWTLQGIGIRTVRLTANNAPLVDGGREEFSLNDAIFDNFAPVPANPNTTRLYVLPRNSKGIGQVSGVDGISPDEIRIRSQFDQFVGQSLAVDLQGDRAAMVTGQGVKLGRLDPDDKNGLHDISTEGTVIGPSFDAAGHLWVVDRASGTAPRIRRIGREEPEEEPVAVTGVPAGQRIWVLRVAPDGVRVLVVAGPEGRRQVMVGRLAGIGAKSGLRLEGFEALHLGLTDVVDAGWSEPARITVLGTRPGIPGVNQPLDVNVDGSVQRRIPGRNNFNLLDLAVSPASGALLVVRDENQRLHIQSRDVSWIEPLTTGRPVYPG